MPNPLSRIIKVGGSLFDLPHLGERIERWLDSQPPAVNILLAGGGRAVDSIRAEAPTLSESEAHWRCVDAMTATASSLCQLMPSAKSQTHIPFHSIRQPTIFLCATWLKHLEPLTPGTKLPESWDVTSDAIAARLAVCVGADELVLLKSVDAPSQNLQELADIDYVDKFLPKLAAELPPWRCVNLRRQ
jgi:5-(aminomethyl)-3-furanmethanol phosphate kinase